MSIWRWEKYLPPIPAAARITLGEGGTPLVRSRSIGPKAGISDLYFKLETMNPSSSYKDRFAVVAISDMVARGKKQVVATTSGNTGAAIAAYCAAAGLRCEITTVEHAPMDKLRQMMAYGAKLYRVRGFGVVVDADRRVFGKLQERGERPDSMLLISAFKYCPVGMMGVKTLAYELAEQAPSPLAHVFCCAGGGGMALATARGFDDLIKVGEVARSPAVECVQPQGNATIAGPLMRGGDHAEAVTCTTKISGLQVPSVIDGDEALKACAASGGQGHLVADEFVWEVQSRLAREEGIFCEPAAAVPLAGALQAHTQKKLRPGPVVCVVTGSGFKDLKAVERMTASQECPVQSVDEWLAAMG